MLNKKMIKEHEDGVRTGAIQYLYNYLITLVLYVISAIVYFFLEENKEGVFSMCVIFAIVHAFEFWLLFLFYKFFFKNSKLIRLFKFIFLMFLGVAFLNFVFSVIYSPHYLLIIAIIISGFSITLQNLILTKEKRKGDC